MIGAILYSSISLDCSWTIGRFLSKENTWYNAIYMLQRHSFSSGMVFLYGLGFLLGDLQYNIVNGTITGQSYLEKVVDPYVRLYAVAIGSDFVLMDDNVRPRRARIVNDYLSAEGRQRMKCSTCSLNLTPIGHVWNALGKAVAFRKILPNTIQAFRQVFLLMLSYKNTDYLAPETSELIQHLISPCIFFCQTCISVRRDDIPID